MPSYRIEALEKFLVHTIYYVDAVNEREAVRMCKDGEVPYEEHVIEEGDDEWIETLSVSEGSK